MKKKVLKRITAVALLHSAAHGQKEIGEIALTLNAGWKLFKTRDQDQRTSSLKRRKTV